MNKISVRGILLRASIAFAGVYASVSPSHAQYESLNPRNWFPLESGNAWEYSAGFNNWIILSTADTVSHGLSWRKLSVVRCDGPSCIAKDQWYAFGNDDYLLQTESFTRIDTAFATLPTSAFRTRTAVDSSLAARCAPGGPYEPGGAVIRESIRGSEKDSTNLELLFGPASGGIFCDYGFFAYKIGYLGPGEVLLTGAIVNGLEWGLTDHLWSILNSEPDVSIPAEINIETYPNPATDFLRVNVRVKRTGEYKLMIVTVLGQTLLRRREFIISDVSARLDIRVDNLAPGHYFLRLSNGLTTELQRFVVAF